jgi:hypothetical protein
MFSNGVVGFLNPTNSWCCSGFDLRNNNGTPFSFAIMPLQTDLINYSGRFLTEGTPQYQRYVWENISEYGRPQNLNTFGVEIRPSGYIGMHYEQINISPGRSITIGMTGDVGEYTQYYHGAGYSTSTPFSYITESTGNICVTNPLSSPTCPGYQEALLVQQCTISSLYSPQCPGYEIAYHDQQCSLNPLYANTCQGYEQAYFNQQCSINPLYNSQCPGYAQAYHNQQCGINPLYATTCQGYEAAYFNQQCSLNPLYNQGCTGYAEAYFTYQCTQNPLYNRTCSGYAEAYALANIVTPRQTITAPTVQVSSTGTISVETPIVADPVVNEVISTPTTTSQTSPTSVAARQTNQVTSQVASQTEKKEEKKEERKEVKPQPKVVATQSKPVETAVGIVPNIKVADMPKGFDIIDHSHKKLIANLPSIRENRRILWMSNDSDKKHREMVDEQWRR